MAVLEIKTNNKILFFSEIDMDRDITIEATDMNKGHNMAMYINRTDAIQIINHLKEQFSIGEEELGWKR